MDGKTLPLKGRGILAKQTCQALPEGRAGAQSSPGGWGGDGTPSDTELGGVLVKTGFYKLVPRWAQEKVWEPD